MFEQQPTLQLLFQQLGLAAEAEAIEEFVTTHQLAQNVDLADAPFWSASQREFLQHRCDQDDEWAISFQSRFGKQEWVKPYTDQLLQQWGEQKVQSVQVISPAFSADCLETLEELAMQNKEIFQHAGGGEYAYIAALNTDQAHIDLLASLVQANLDALTHTLAHR